MESKADEKKKKKKKRKAASGLDDSDDVSTTRNLGSVNISSRRLHF